MGILIKNFYDEICLDYDGGTSDDIFKKIKEKYLSEISEEEYTYYLNQKIVKGIIFGEMSSLFVNIPVLNKETNKKIMVLFVIISEAKTYLCEKVLTELGFTHPFRESFEVDINNKTYEIINSDHMYQWSNNGLNILGSNFFTKSNCKLVVDYSLNDVSITFP